TSSCPAGTRCARPRSTSTGTVPRVCRRARWGAGSTRTSCSSGPRSRAAPCSARRSMGFERTGSEQIWQGRIAGVRVDRFRHDDGEEVSREIVTHPGAVAVVACDDEHVWLVRQPREPVGDPALLELPAGKLDADGESPLDTAKRELAEEIGKAADHWEHLVSFWSSPG